VKNHVSFMHVHDDNYDIFQQLHYTVFRKKHPLTFSFISQCVMSRFKQNLQ